ncbi:hypothetical protein [Clostridium algidicarnis]|uniref:hypothetical protein n=1 Tax=Clostridium algidicarnis TaxID=37659 RepID=UPI001C0BE7DC|nr:hypothetical protein [Clostridium algidicarnis]MBU3209043.1 hypothetical protein [Clostridium algidicarnis]MBU3228765.1 hypothetical protein [Clostridium algidicarnis]MBU3252309.1 hypothetical protein [Clostridium algidicarnis]
MFCRFCGKEIFGGNVKCSECGIKLVSNNDEKIKKDKNVNKKVMIFAISVVILVLIGFGINYINTKRFDSEIPTSNYINKNNVIFRGNNKNIYAWATVSHRTDGKLSTTLNKNPGWNLICYRILISNKSNTNLNIDVSQFTLVLGDNDVVNLFKGENDAIGLRWLNPIIMEVNGTDISTKQKKDISILKDSYCVVEAYYVIKNEEDEQAAINKTKEIKAGISTSKGLVDIILNKIVK